MKMRRFILVFCAMFIFVSQSFAASATAIIRGTTEGSTIFGVAYLTEKNEGLDVQVALLNVPPGKHGFHIHEKGDCSDVGKAAGGHYNPQNVLHGLITRDGMEHAHPGDFGNVEISPTGSGLIQAFVPHLTLTGEKFNVAGLSFILHEKEDDFSQPTGNAGARIGCGIIQLTLDSYPQVQLPKPMSVEESVNKIKADLQSTTDSIGDSMQKTGGK